MKTLTRARAQGRLFTGTAYSPYVVEGRRLRCTMCKQKVAFKFRRLHQRLYHKNEMMDESFA